MRKQSSTEGDSVVSEEATSYDSDEEPPPVTQKSVLNWRLGPEESLSDWTIELVVNDKTYATYHVHKQNLAVGPRRSEYFVKLFSAGGRFAESENSTSRIELEELAAESFPILLDYLYSEVATLPFNTSNASALHSMAKYFDMPRLRWEAKQFWQKDVKRADTCGTYYEHARILQDDKILQAATQACSDNIMKICETSRLVNVPEPSFWLEMLKSRPKNAVSAVQFSGHMSTLIAKFAALHPDLGSDMFQKLTDAELLPHIHNEAALPLINAERIIVAPVETSLSCLQRRCIAALVQHWGNMDIQSQGSVMMQLAKKQNPVVLAEILAGTISAAKQDKIKLERDLESSFHRYWTEVRENKEELRLKNRDLAARRTQLAKFHRFVSSPSHLIENGSVDKSSLPERFPTFGTNVKLHDNISNNSRNSSYPLFYYKP